MEHTYNEKHDLSSSHDFHSPNKIRIPTPILARDSEPVFNYINCYQCTLCLYCMEYLYIHCLTL